MFPQGMARRTHKIKPLWSYDLWGTLGKQLAVTFALTNPDTEEAIDLTGYTGSGVVYDEDGSTVITLSVTIGEATGLVSLNQQISALLTPGRYDWYIDLTDSGGAIYRRFEGKFNLQSATPYI